MSWISEQWLLYFDIPAQISGMVGMAMVVYAYLALERGWLGQRDIRLYVVNLVGSVLLLLSLLIHFNLGSIIIEIFWISISLSGMVKGLRGTEKEVDK